MHLLWICIVLLSRRKFEVVTMEFNAASESLHAHSGGENGVLNKFSSFFDTSAEEGGVNVWEPNERKPVSYSDQFLPDIFGG